MGRSHSNVGNKKSSLINGEPLEVGNAQQAERQLQRLSERNPEKE